MTTSNPIIPLRPIARTPQPPTVPRVRSRLVLPPGVAAKPKLLSRQRNSSLMWWRSSAYCSRPSSSVPLTRMRTISAPIGPGSTLCCSASATWSAAVWPSPAAVTTTTRNQPVGRLRPLSRVWACAQAAPPRIRRTEANQRAGGRTADPGSGHMRTTPAMRTE